MATIIVSKVIRVKAKYASFRFRNPKAALRVCGQLERRGFKHICSMRCHVKHDWTKTGFTLLLWFNASGSTALISASVDDGEASVDVRWRGSAPEAALKREAEAVAGLFAAAFEGRS